MTTNTNDVDSAMMLLCTQAMDRDGSCIMPGDFVVRLIAGKPCKEFGCGLVLSIRLGTSPNDSNPRVAMADVMWTGLNSPSRFLGALPWTLKKIENT